MPAVTQERLVSSHFEVYTKCLNTVNDSVNIYNGVKQGGVISPILCTVYLDELLLRLRESRMGYHIGNVLCGALSYPP